MTTVVLLVHFVNTFMGSDAITIARFKDAESCEAARAMYTERLSSQRRFVSYGCITGVVQ
jgi:hypothetical protein